MLRLDFTLKKAKNGKNITSQCTRARPGPLTQGAGAVMSGLYPTRSLASLWLRSIRR